ncbi:MAG: nucleotide exchange factor GrpE [Myxococcota bacterium]|nr:nucleotide exchange factor GrpE [Myxococcota bacterium]
MSDVVNDQDEMPDDGVPTPAAGTEDMLDGLLDADVVEIVDPNPELTATKAELSELQARLRAVSAAYRQLQEEVEATKERLNRQAQFQRELQRGETVAKMFDPLDNLTRSIESVNEPDTKAGLKMVVHQFMGALSELGLEMLNPEGAKFDPNEHEALSVLPVDDPAKDDAVIEVFSAGYRVGSRLLKPARVVIGKFEESDA